MIFFSCIQFSRVNAVSNENLGFLQQMNEHLCGENKVNLFGRRHVEQTFFHSVDMHWKLMNHFAIFLKKERKKRSIFTLDRSFASIFFFAVFDSIWKLETELIFHRNKLTVHEFHFVIQIIYLNKLHPILVFCKIHAWMILIKFTFQLSFSMHDWIPYNCKTVSVINLSTEAGKFCLQWFADI